MKECRNPRMSARSDAHLELVECPVGSTDEFCLRDCEVDPITRDAVEADRLIRVRINGRGLVCYDVESLYTALTHKNRETISRGVFSAGQLARITERMRDLNPGKHIAALHEHTDHRMSYLERMAATGVGEEEEEDEDEEAEIRDSWAVVDPTMRDRIERLARWRRERLDEVVAAQEIFREYYYDLDGFEAEYSMEREIRRLAAQIAAERRVSLSDMFRSTEAFETQEVLEELRYTERRLRRRRSASRERRPPSRERRRSPSRDR